MGNTGKSNQPQKFGIGSLALLINIIVFAAVLINTRDGKLGEVLLSKTPFTIPYGIIAIALVLLSYLLGKKYQQDKFALAGVKSSIIFLALLATFSIVSLIFFRGH